MRGEASADERVRADGIGLPRSIVGSLLITALAAACGSDDEPVLVLAAASLTDVFTEMEAGFEAAEPDVDIEFAFAGSNSLEVQVEQGAPADLVAFADAAPMDALVTNGDVERSDVTVFARNRLVLVTPPDDPGDVDSLDDLADPDRTIGLCAPAVPCGRLADQVLDRAGVDASPDTEEPDVRSLVAKIVSGELDAGLVYATDAVAFGDQLRVVDVSDTDGVANDYLIAVLLDAPSDVAGREFVEFVLSDAGSRILLDAGFDLP